jgi:hypothetical protein
MSQEELYGLSLRYLIGGWDDDPSIEPETDVIYEFGFDVQRPSRSSMLAIKYGNLLDQSKTDRYGPYLVPTGNALAFNLKVPDPKKTGYYLNIHSQLELAQKFGYKLIEWDNPDNENFVLFDLKRAIDVAMTYKIGVIFKNPGLIKFDITPLIAHPNVFGMIVEENCGIVPALDKLRRDAKKPLLPIWFVSYGSSDQWAQDIATEARRFFHMGVTHSYNGRYNQSLDVFKPRIRVEDAAMQKAAEPLKDFKGPKQVGRSS